MFFITFAKNENFRYLKQKFPTKKINIMKKKLFLTITLSVIALAAVFTFSITFFAENKMLTENVEALGAVFELTDNISLEFADEGSAEGQSKTCIKNYIADPKGTMGKPCPHCWPRIAMAPGGKLGLCGGS